MKHYIIIMLTLVLTLALAACGSSTSTPPLDPSASTSPAGSDTSASTSPAGSDTSATPVPAATSSVGRLDMSYEDAPLSARTILMLGTLNLAGTENAVTPEQATQLLPLWQLLRSSITTGGGAQEELDALLAQIEETMTAAQIEAINAMQITQAAMSAWAASSGFSPSPEMQVTMQATMRASGGTGSGSSSSSGAGTALLDETIEYLEGLTR